MDEIEKLENKIQKLEDEIDQLNDELNKHKFKKNNLENELLELVNDIHDGVSIKLKELKSKENEVDDIPIEEYKEFVKNVYDYILEFKKSYKIFNI